MMNKSLGSLTVVILLFILPAAGMGAVVPVYGGVVAGAEVTSLRQMRFSGMVPQQLDFSCGAASVATLLTHHYGVETDEGSVIIDMYARGNQVLIREKGFSLLDMQNYLKRRGVAANGYQVALQDIERVSVPGIVLLDIDGYLHFVVVKGLTEHEVLIADPARGVARYDRERFEKMWNGLYFIIEGHWQLAKSSFNRRADWMIRPAAPLGLAVDRESLASFSMLLAGPNEF